MTAFVTDICERCGNLRSVCSNPESVWYPQRAICYATATAQQMHRRTERAYKHPEHDDPTPHVTDGSEWWASPHDLTPEDDFFGDSALLAGGSQQTVGDQAEAAEGKE